MKAIIFGVNGQDGYYLSKLLEKNEVKVIGISKSGINCTMGDVSDFNFVKKIIKKHKPEYIFNFAVISSREHKFLFDNHNTVSTGTLNILECTRLHCPKTKVFLSGSALHFKNTGKPITEKTPFEAKSPYSVARIHSVYAARYYRYKFNLNIYIGYFFNHGSPLRKESHLSKMNAEAVKRIGRGSSEKIEIGDRNAKKEFNFAGDIVEAIWILVNQDKIHEAVIGSGKAYSVRDFVKNCFQKFNKDWQEHVITKNDCRSEYRTLVSDPKLIKKLGWRPKVSFDKIISLMVE